MVTRMAGPPREQLERWLELGMTQAEIADAWREQSGRKIARSTVGKLLQRHGLAPSRPQADSSQEIPWDLRPEDLWHTIVRRLRYAARVRRGLPTPATVNNVTQANGLRDMLEIQDLRHAALGYSPTFVQSGPDREDWPFRWLDRAEGDRPLDIPDFGVLYLSLYGIPSDRLSDEERRSLEKRIS